MRHLFDFKWILILTAFTLGISSCDDTKSWMEVNPPIPVVKSAEITLNELSAHDMTVSLNKGSGVYTMALTGSDPYITTNALIGSLPEDSVILEFEYQLDKDLWMMGLYFAPPYTQQVQLKGLTKTFEWEKVTIDISRYRKEFNWGKKGGVIRFDWGTEKDRTIKLRNLKLRGFNEEEKAENERQVSRDEERERISENFLKYLYGNYPSSVTNVEVTTDKVIIQGNAAGSGTFALADITPYDNPTEVTGAWPSERTTSISGGNFTVTLDRKVERDGFTYDRLLSRWAVIKNVNGKDTLDSHARYADEVAPIKSPAYYEAPNKKGVLGIGTTKFPDGVTDLNVLGLGFATWGLHINAMIQTKMIDATDVAYTYGGHTYYMSGPQTTESKRILEAYDNLKMQINSYVQYYEDDQTRDHDIESFVRHPDSKSGYQHAINTETAEGVNAYAAYLTYMGEKWGDKVMNYFVHNEVNAPDEWCNMGYNPPEGFFMDYYLKSMHIVYNIMRQYNQNISTCITLTHHWNKVPDGEYPGRLMVDQLLQASKSEGDWPWGLSYHSYPSNLNVPEFWSKDGSKATFQYETTPRITMNNLEVLQYWAEMPEHLYKGEMRRIFCTEQGTNSPSYSSSDLRLQAAGAAWFWKKVNGLSAIKGASWHAWVDNRHEFGLRIGLRKYPDDESNPYQRKEVWNVWRRAGTNNEDATFNNYRDVLGISSWDEIFKTVY
ncbi:MAG: hypothetical protein J6X81_01320 [Muribaculaceae bacterium]|nr:hypothetical protein [Muribaculaceae bacterium]